MLKFIKNNKGVTLLELVVSVTIFSVIVLSATGIFKMVIEGQRNAIAAQNLQESMRYALEIMGKEMRMAQKNDGFCDIISGSDKVYQTNGAILYFRNYNDECVVYNIDSGRLKIYRDIVGDSAPENVFEDYITPDEIIVSNLKFIAVESVSTGQPVVTMKMDIEADTKDLHKQKTTLQTTISSRYYE